MSSVAAISQPTRQKLRVGSLLGVLGALTAVPLAATIQIFVQELTKARREQVAAAKSALDPALSVPAAPS